MTCVALNPAGTRVAAGYTDGTVRIWKLDDLDITTGRHGAGTGLLCSLTGHKSRVACVKFNETGSLLMSGGADTDVVVWDVVGQAGLYRCAASGVGAPEASVCGGWVHTGATLSPLARLPCSPWSPHAVRPGCVVTATR